MEPLAGLNRDKPEIIKDLSAQLLDEVISEIENNRGTVISPQGMTITLSPQLVRKIRAVILL